ncbi:alpha/beta-hydrolase [Acephala macrosclerotiorum]|nr:alpha/beta-hydrolase [Acephala macrosclerotiorum]
MAYPSIVFCHGAWHTPDFFHKVIAILEPLGYKCVTVALPSSSGRVPPTTDLGEDIAAIRSVVLKELEAGHDVVMHAHSWGGIPTSSALEGLTKPERLASGKTTGVTKLTYVSAFVIPENTSLEEFIGGPQPTWVIDDVSFATTRRDLKQIFYHDVDSKEADEWLAKLKPQSLASFTKKTTDAAWKRIPSAYLICEDDRAVSAAFQEIMTGQMKGAGVEIVETRIGGSHSPYLTRPNGVVKFLRAAIGEPLECRRHEVPKM